MKRQKVLQVPEHTMMVLFSDVYLYLQNKSTQWKRFREATDIIQTVRKLEQSFNCSSLDLILMLNSKLFKNLHF